MPRVARLVLVLLVLLAAAVSPEAARADGPVAVGGPDVTTALQIAQQHWGAVPCHGEATVAWTSQADRQVNAMSSWANPVDAYADPDENLDCVVALNPDASWDWPKLCTVVTHEVGHLLGRQHSPDPADVMYAIYLKPTPECESTPEPEGTLTAAVEQARASVQAQHAAFAAEAGDPVTEPAPPVATPASGGTVRSAPTVDALDAGTSLAAGSTASRAAVRAATRKRATCLRRAGRIKAPARRRAARRTCVQAGLRSASAASREPFDALGGVVAPRRGSGAELLAFAPFGLLLLLLASGRVAAVARRRGPRAA